MPSCGADSPSHAVGSVRGRSAGHAEGRKADEAWRRLGRLACRPPPTQEAQAVERVLGPAKVNQRAADAGHDPPSRGDDAPCRCETGLRRGEAIGLRWPDPEDPYEPTRGANAAERCRHVRRHRLATSRPRDGALVFADERGKALTPNGRPRHAFRRATQRADWPSHCPRCTTYATPTPPLCWPRGSPCTPWPSSSGTRRRRW